MEKNEGVLRQSFLAYRTALKDCADDKVKAGGGKDE
jgi:hypothetical protein